VEAIAPRTSADTSLLSLLQRLAQARALSDEIFAVVRPEALYDRPIPERHRIIFYLGHLEAFDWNLLNGRLFDLPPLAPAFERLFAFGIDPVDGGLPSDQPKDWPARNEVEAYNRRVRETVDERLAALDASSPRQREAVQLLNVAIEHRLMHVETLSYMLHQLPIDRKYRRENWPAPAAAARSGPAHSIKIPQGTATLGLRRTEDGPFGWDNEFEEHSVTVPAFLIDERKVTNGDFLRFLAEGGYRERSLWSEEDWNWIASSGTTHPAFWLRRDNRWLLRTMFDEAPLPLDWPVYVSHAEASAYAHWTGFELPSEAEWHRAAYATPQGPERAYPWGDQTPDPGRGNFDFERWDAAPTGAFTAGKSAYGVADLLGNGWEWTRTVFAPFEGFEVFPCYPGYSANFFDGKHYVLKGGSARTARCMLRRSFRNWFQPHYPFIYSGFRCVKH
jgi:gamma-glutamyl hercynylcysteine S-oxide synthase